MTGPGRFIPRRKVRLLALTFIVATVSAMAMFQLVTGTRVGRELEYKATDLRFQARGPRPVDSDIVVLAVDNNTDERTGTRWPYPRDFHADIVRTLDAAGAKAIVFDVQFLEPTDAAADRDFVDAIRATNGKVVLATAPETGTGASLDRSRSDNQKTPLPFRGLKLAGYSDALLESGAVIGNAQELNSSDDVRRWINPLKSFQLEDGTDKTIPSLSLAALTVADHTSAFDMHGLPEEMEINYSGPASTYQGVKGFTYRNYGDLCAFAGTNRPCRFDPQLAASQYAWARNKIVLIGATSAVLQDLHATPFPGKLGAAAKADGADSSRVSREMPGVEIHANAIQTLRDRSWLHRQTSRDAALWTAGLVFLILILLAFTPMPAGIGGSIVALGAYLYFAQRAFEHQQVWQVAATFSAVFTAFFVTVMVLAIQGVRERRRVTGLFARYVSPDVVRELVDISEELVVGGERREISVLFSDIRGFTTLSEGLDPAELVNQLNEYFEEMTEAIEWERGTLDKFIGDGLMAIFGAPLHQPDHADRACAVALAMCERLDELNVGRTERGLPQLAIGIGVHTGEAIVGNIGSPARRVEFTAIGDTVNLASRLESNTKTVGARILVSNETVAACTEHRFESRGAIVVKGRTQATDVFELLPHEVGQDGQRTPDAATGRPEDVDASASATPDASDPGQAA
jgi:adenylate cyclase